MATVNSSYVKKPKKRWPRILMWVEIVFVVLFLVVYFGIGAYAASSLTQPKRQFDPANDPSVYNLRL